MKQKIYFIYCRGFVLLYYVLRLLYQIKILDYRGYTTHDMSNNSFELFLIIVLSSSWIITSGFYFQYTLFQS